MEWFNILISAIATLVGLVGGGAGIYFWRENKAQKNIDNAKSLSDGWEKLYEKVALDNETKDKKLDELYNKYIELNDAVVENKKEIVNLRLELYRSECYRCEVLECKKRIPPMTDNKLSTLKGNTNEQTNK